MATITPKDRSAAVAPTAYAVRDAATVSYAGSTVDATLDDALPRLTAAEAAIDATEAVANAALPATAMAADSHKLDGSHSSAFATSAQGTLADAALPRAGGAVTGHVTMNNAIALMGKTTGGTGVTLANVGSDNKAWLGSGGIHTVIASIADAATGILRSNGTLNYKIWDEGTLPASYAATADYVAKRDGGGNCVFNLLYTTDGVVHAISDIRFKNRFGDFSRGLAEILALEPYRYKYKEGNSKALNSTMVIVGVNADDVRKVIPEAVDEDAEGVLSMSIGPIFYAALNAIKELAGQVAELTKRVEKLEKP